MGWGVVRRDGNRVQHVAHGVIRLDPKLALALRLVAIEAALDGIVREFAPATAAVETLFFHRDPQAAAKLGHARGVALLVLARAGVALHEYQPARIKLTVTGSGKAEKHQVAEMVRGLLGLDKAPSHDAADALAVALTHTRIAGRPALQLAALRAKAPKRVRLAPRAS